MLQPGWHPHDLVLRSFLLAGIALRLDHGQLGNRVAPARASQWAGSCPTISAFLIRPATSSSGARIDMTTTGPGGRVDAKFFAPTVTTETSGSISRAISVRGCKP